MRGTDNGDRTNRAGIHVQRQRSALHWQADRLFLLPHTSLRDENDQPRTPCCLPGDYICRQVDVWLGCAMILANTKSVTLGTKRVDPELVYAEDLSESRGDCGRSRVQSDAPSDQMGSTLQLAGIVPATR